MRQGLDVVHTRAVRICNMLVWFPTKVRMPLASSNDVILAGIQDIVHALQNPSPLPPLIDNHHDALMQLTELLISVAAPPRAISVPTDINLPAPSATPPAIIADSPPREDLTPVPAPLPIATMPDPTLRVETVPLAAQSTASPKGVSFWTASYEYMRIPIDMIPDVIMDEYNLCPLIHNGFVYVKIRRGMYGLPQAGCLANDQLIKHLAPPRPAISNQMAPSISYAKLCQCCRS